MREVQPWDDYFLQLCDVASTRSKDPSTQVGAVIVRDHDVLAMGYNGFPAGVEETTERWERPTKYEFVVHAEMNAIARAARHGVNIDGATLYTRLLPCAPCARVIANSGIREVVHNGHIFDSFTRADDHGMRFSVRLLEEAGLTVRAHYPTCYASLVPHV